MNLENWLTLVNLRAVSLVYALAKERDTGSFGELLHGRIDAITSLDAKSKPASA